jgi:predicted secreted Zn-dependent protease
MGALNSWKGTTMQDATLTWRKSTRSGAAGHCVEVASGPAAVLVRDSKDAGGPVLAFAETDWAGFIAGVRAGEFDHPGA